jgi:hypothetical protein
MPKWTKEEFAAWQARSLSKSAVVQSPAPTKPPPASISFKPSLTTDEDKLNKTERAFLVLLRLRGAERVRIQAVRLKLADNCTYLPDFSCSVAGRFTFYETKGGFMREDGWLKLKLAARLYPEFDFVLAVKTKQGWKETPVKV